MDYPGQDFTKLKYSDTSTPIIQRDQSYLNPHTDFASTWPYSVAFHHCIKNSDSLAPKYSEFLASHYGDLRSERYSYSYVSRAAFDSRMLASESLIQWRCILTSHLYAIPVSPHSLVKRTTNPYGTQWPSLDKCHHSVMTYNLVANLFKNYTINPLFIVH